jgi:ArsR family transcriptional regulator
MRLEIYRLIAAQVGPLCVCDVVERIPLHQPTVSHHLKVLREAGLVTVIRDGKWAYYSPNPKGLALLQDAASWLSPERRVAAH